jgi:hypothetical protein
MQANQEKNINLDNFWTKIKNKTQSLATAGDTPILIIDLDGTLVDYRYRTHRIFQKAIEEIDPPDNIASLIKSVKPEQYDFYPILNFARIGIKDEALLKQLHNFWHKYYFSNHYLQYDRPMPGARQFVENFLKLKIHITYLTGRDRGNMGDGTREWLIQNGFLEVDDPCCNLLMKTDLGLKNHEAKALNVEKMRALGQPVAIIDNEPIDLQTIWQEFPRAIPVLVEMPNSGQPAELPDHVLKIKDFRELNSYFNR